MSEKVYTDTELLDFLIENMGEIAGMQYGEPAVSKEFIDVYHASSPEAARLRLMEMIREEETNETT